VAILSAAAVVPATTPPSEPAGTPGEGWAIAERARLWRQRHGDPDAPTRLARAGLAERLHRTKSADEPGWVSLGPVDGAGRCTTIAPHPDRPGDVLVGAAGGGVWRTTDDGASWHPLTDHLPDLSVGALARAPSDPDIVYLGTGEGGLAFDFIPGVGLLRSDDGGLTWLLPDEVVASQFFTLTVDPRDPDRLLAGTDEGLLASDDGGHTWEIRVADPSLLGVTELVRSGADPDRLWAALWCVTECPAGLARVLRSDDGGLSWHPSADGLPPPEFNDAAFNRSSLAVSPSDPDVLYAGLEVRSADDGRSFVYRSSDGGDSWAATDYRGNYLFFQSWYDNAITVAPDDPDRVVAAGVWYVDSSDGGATWSTLNPYDGAFGTGSETVPHVDGHDLQWQGDVLWLATDGGMWRSGDGGRSWRSRNQGLVTRQFYSLSLDPSRPHRVLGGTQDNGTNLRRADGARWDMVVPFDGFDSAINPLITDFMYATLYRTRVFRTLVGPDVEWQEVTPPIGGETAPFATALTMRAEAPWELYTGATRVWHTVDGGDSWRALSTSVLDGGWSPYVVTSIATTPADPDRLLAGKGEAVYASADGGATWRVHEAAARVNHVELSPHDAELGFAAVARNGSPDGQLLRTTDGGVTWTPSGTGLPSFATQVVRVHPTDPAVVYAGTDVGLYRSTDGGVHWSRYGDGLPAASVHDIRLDETGRRLVVATHGRGAWELAAPPPGNRPPEVRLVEPAGPVEVAIGVPLRFRAEATDPDGDPLDIGWLFTDHWQRADGGAGPAPLASEASHLYRRAGSSKVAVHATDGNGGVDSAVLAVTAYEPGDSCETPRVVPGAGPFPWLLETENQSSAPGGGDPLVPCASRPDDPDAGRWGSIWFEMTPEVTGRWAIATCGSRADTVLSAWTGPRCGPYAPVDGGCNDDDGYVHCSGSRTDSYLELELTAGETVRWMVGSWDEEAVGDLRVQVRCLDCEPDGPRRWVVPAVAHAGGVAGTTWRTDLSLLNPSAVPVVAGLELLGEDGDAGGVASSEVTVPAGGQLELPDVVAALLGGAGAGALHVTSDAELVVSSRTFNDATGGTYGQGIPGAAVESGVLAGGAARLVGLREGDGFRTNVGLANVDPVPVRLEIDLRRPDGGLVTTTEMTLPPRGRIQLDRPYAAHGGTDGGTVVVRNVGADGRVAAYASVVDDGTGDPVYLSTGDLASAGSPLVVAAAARTDGAAGSSWRTDLDLVNVSDLDLLATISLVPPPGVPPPPPLTFLIVRRARLGIADVVGRLTGADGSGAVLVEVDRGYLAASSRTFTGGPGGTYGQHIPGVAAGSALAPGQVAVLSQLAEGPSRRTNVGFVNLAGVATEVVVTAHDAAGRPLGTSLRVTVPPLAWRQLHRPLPAGTAFATVTTPTGGAALLAYASVVDNRSNDPVYVPARVVEPTVVAGR